MNAFGIIAIANDADRVLPAAATTQPLSKNCARRIPFYCPDLTRVYLGLGRRQLTFMGGERAVARKKKRTRRLWTKDDNRLLKSLARKEIETSQIAKQLKRSLGATYQQASKLGVSFR
jgi:hypothetical protein